MIDAVYNTVKRVAGGDVRVVARRGNKAVRFLTTSSTVVDEVRATLKAEGFRFVVEQGAADTSGVPPCFVILVSPSVYWMQMCTKCLMTLSVLWAVLAILLHIRGGTPSQLAQWVRL
jgi:hypothetical protein